MKKIFSLPRVLPAGLAVLSSSQSSPRTSQKAFFNVAVGCGSVLSLVYHS